MVKGKVVDVQNDQNGNIKVFTEFTDNEGKLIQRGATRYSFAVLPSIDDIKKILEEDIEDHCKKLIARIYATKKNLAEKDNLKSLILGLEKQATEGSLLTKTSKLDQRIRIVNENELIRVENEVIE